MSELPAKTKDLMSKCLRCGGCRTVCPSYAEGGCDPLTMMSGDFSKLKSCIGCGKCSGICENTDPRSVMLQAKCSLQDLQVPESFYRCGYIMDPAPAYDLPDQPVGEDVYVMPGCIVSCRVPFLKYATAVALNALDIGNMELPCNTCCMNPPLVRSMEDSERDSYKERLMFSSNGREIVTLCGGCCNELDRSGIYAPHISTFLSRFINAIEDLPGCDLTVAVQPGCSAEPYAEAMEAVVRATGAKTIGNPYGCCGRKAKDVCGKIMEKRQKEMEGVDAVVVGCPNCVMFYDKVPDGTPVIHLSELVALAAGDKETQRFHNLKIKKLL